jgi:hypothetical protein
VDVARRLSDRIRRPRGSVDSIADYFSVRIEPASSRASHRVLKTAPNGTPLAAGHPDRVEAARLPAACLRLRLPVPANTHAAGRERPWRRALL